MRALNFLQNIADAVAGAPMQATTGRRGFLQAIGAGVSAAALAASCGEEQTPQSGLRDRDRNENDDRNEEQGYAENNDDTTGQSDASDADETSECNDERPEIIYFDMQRADNGSEGAIITTCVWFECGSATVEYFGLLRLGEPIPAGFDPPGEVSLSEREVTEAGLTFSTEIFLPTSITLHNPDTGETYEMPIEGIHGARIRVTDSQGNYTLSNTVWAPGTNPLPWENAPADEESGS